LKQMLTDAYCTSQVDKALSHPFLEPVRRMQSETVEPNPFGMEFENVPLNKDALKGQFSLSFISLRHHDSLLITMFFCSTSAHLRRSEPFLGRQCPMSDTQLLQVGDHPTSIGAHDDGAGWASIE
jgi:hypothetical protein